MLVPHFVQEGGVDQGEPGAIYMGWVKSLVAYEQSLLTDKSQSHIIVFDFVCGTPCS